MSETLTRKEFAELNGWVPSYVTKLAKADRLVFTDDGKRVKVAESLARIKATEDPNRDDVKKRWAGERGESEQLQGRQEQPRPEDRVGNTFQTARALNEKYKALRAKTEYEQAIGKLCETEDVRMGAADVGTVLRMALEIMPDQMSPQLASITDEERVHAMLVEWVESVLEDISRRLDEIASELAKEAT